MANDVTIQLGVFMIEVKELKTDRLTLKKISISDLEDYIEWKSQERYHCYLPSNVKGEEEYKKTINKIVSRYNDSNDPNLIWGIFYNNKLVGSVSIEDWNTTHKWCEIGWGLNPSYQNKGFAFEATKCLMDYIFNCLDMKRIEIVIWDGNISSIKLAQKLGFVKEGVSRKARIKNNKYFDLLHFGILKNEWELSVQ